MSNSTFGYELSGTVSDRCHYHQAPSTTVEQSHHYRLPQQSQYPSDGSHWQHPSSLSVLADTNVPKYLEGWPIQSAGGYNEMTTEFEPSNGTPMMLRVCTFAAILSFIHSNRHQHQGSHQDPSPLQGPTVNVELPTLRAGSGSEAPLRCTVPSCKAKDEDFKSKAALK
jgi:hypothetical protein